MHPPVVSRERAVRADGERFSAPIARQVDVVRRVFEAFAGRDIEGVIGLCDPDVRFVPVTAQVARDGEAYEGHEGLRQYGRDVLALWEELELLPREYQAVVGVVVVIGEVHGRGGGGEFSAPVVWTWRLRGEKIVEGIVHSGLSAPREALGISPDGV